MLALAALAPAASLQGLLRAGFYFERAVALIICCSCQLDANCPANRLLIKSFIQTDSGVIDTWEAEPEAPPS